MNIFKKTYCRVYQGKITDEKKAIYFNNCPDV